jgi:hypothetical protein
MNDPVSEMESEWITYRTRFLIRARRLDSPMTFVDSLGREHSGQIGDYLVLSSEGSQRIAPREIFEDIYVPMYETALDWTAGAQTSKAQLELLQRDTRALQSQLAGPRNRETAGPPCRSAG